MPDTPSHYRFYVKAPFEHAGVQFLPGVRYTVKTAVYEEIVGLYPESLDEAQPLFQ